RPPPGGGGGGLWGEDRRGVDSAPEGELPRQIPRPRRAPAHLAARRLGQRALPEEKDLPGLDLVAPRDGIADRFDDLLRLGAAPAVDLRSDDQPLLAVRLDGERRRAAGMEVRVARLGRPFEILRVVVAPAQDDQVLVPAGDEQVPALLEPQIAGAQIAGFARLGGLARDPRAEGLGAQLGPPPVAVRDRGAADPDLADPTRSGSPARLGIDDREPVFLARAAAAHQPS